MGMHSAASAVLLAAALLACCLAPAHSRRSRLAGAAAARREAFDANLAKPHHRSAPKHSRLGASGRQHADASSLRERPDRPPRGLPANWVAYWSAGRQAYYYYNTQTDRKSVV